MKTEQYYTPPAPPMPPAPAPKKRSITVTVALIAAGTLVALAIIGAFMPDKSEPATVSAVASTSPSTVASSSPPSPTVAAAAALPSCIDTKLGIALTKSSTEHLQRGAFWAILGQPRKSVPELRAARDDWTKMANTAVAADPVLAVRANAVASDLESAMTDIQAGDIQGAVNTLKVMPKGSLTDFNRALGNTSADKC
jgi:hypothetical protein